MKKKTLAFLTGSSLLTAGAVVLTVFGIIHAVIWGTQPRFVSVSGAVSSSLGFLITAGFFFGFALLFYILGGVGGWLTWRSWRKERTLR